MFNLKSALERYKKQVSSFQEKVESTLGDYGTQDFADSKIKDEGLRFFNAKELQLQVINGFLEDVEQQLGVLDFNLARLFAIVVEEKPLHQDDATQNLHRQSLPLLAKYISANDQLKINAVIVYKQLLSACINSVNHLIKERGIDPSLINELYKEKKLTKVVPNYLNVFIQRKEALLKTYPPEIFKSTRRQTVDMFSGSSGSSRDIELQSQPTSYGYGATASLQRSSTTTPKP